MSSPNASSSPLFEEFFQLGKEETASPFLKPKERKWSSHLDLKTTFLAAFFLLLSFFLSYFPHFFALSRFFLAFTYFLAGVPLLIESIEDLISLEINIDILMTLAAFSSLFIGNGMEGGLLLTLFALSGAIEENVAVKAKSALHSLQKLSPTKALVREENGVLIERALRQVPVGATIVVRAGQIVPLDGKAIEGMSSFNLVHLTGENFPVPKEVGDEIPAGALNLEGAVVLRVLRSSADSALSRIIHLVSQAQEARPRLQRWFDEVSQTYALGIIFFSLFFALTAPWFSSLPYLTPEGSLYRSLTFLIAASPCALILAIPIAYLSAISSCARQGIALKGGIALDALASCRAVAFDKTGTLTTGNLVCEAIEPFFSEEASSFSSKDALAIAYSLETNAVHPIAKAIIAYAQEEGVAAIPLRHFQLVPGQGLQATLEKEGQATPVYLGRPSYIAAQLPASERTSFLALAAERQAEGSLLAILAVGKTFYLFRFRDEVRLEVKETLHALRKMYALRVILLTGDHFPSAQRIAKEMDIEEFHAELQPEDKLRFISALSAQYPLAMVGDGINDAPALARATVGICMGKEGSSTAAEASDIILLQDNIERLDWLFGKARQTQAIVKQNLVVAAGAILIAVIPALAGWVPLWLAVILHEGGTALVGLNGLRLLRGKIKSKSLT